jgi:hypothetical protein
MRSREVWFTVTPRLRQVHQPALGKARVGTLERATNESTIWIVKASPVALSGV